MSGSVTQPESSENICTNAGYSYGQWNSSETLTAAISFLKSYSITESLYIGLKKKIKFKTVSSTLCTSVSGSSAIARNLEWMTAPTKQAVPSFLFNSASVTFDHCSHMYIYFRRYSNGRLFFGDGFYQRRTLCVRQFSKNDMKNEF